MDLDHRTMAPPFIRESHRVSSPQGTDVVVWDLRLGQPNITRIPGRVLHSVEHALIVYLRRDSPCVITAAPMGCGTGFYIVALGSVDFTEMSRLVSGALHSLLEAEDVPLANTAQCGAAHHHSLAGAHEVARWLLSRRDDWGNAAHPTT
jgi:S-ribosylhomocysteine lyase